MLLLPPRPRGQTWRTVALSSRFASGNPPLVCVPLRKALNHGLPMNEMRVLRTKSSYKPQVSELLRT